MVNMNTALMQALKGTMLEKHIKMEECIKRVEARKRIDNEKKNEINRRCAMEIEGLKLGHLIWIATEDARQLRVMPKFKSQYHWIKEIGND